MADSSSSGDRLALRPPFSPEEVAWIDQELTAILSSSYFRNSRRYPSFLTYIVRATLQGRSEEIKERNVGVEAFARSADYDTNLDPIVRNTASEVRKRLALYSASSSASRGRVQISLPAGSYVPEFQLRVSALPSQPSAASLDETAEPAFAHALDLERGIPVPELPRLEPHFPPAQMGRGGSSTARRVGWLLLLAFCALVAGWSGRRLLHPVRPFWADFLSARQDILIVVPAAPNPTGPIPPNWAKDNQNIALEDLSAIIPATGVMLEHHLSYELKLDSAVTLDDMNGRPVILIGGPTNRWTNTLSEKLRYRMTKKPGLLYIEDTQKPGPPICSYQTDSEHLSVVNDCGIIARFFSPLTGNTVIVIAGAGRNGTQAAGEWISSSDLTKRLSLALPNKWDSRNLEIILQTTVINGKSSSPTVLSALSW